MADDTQSQQRRRRSSALVSQKLRHTRPAEAKAIALAEELAVLVRWLREGIFTVAGPSCPSAGGAPVALIL